MFIIISWFILGLIGFIITLVSHDPAAVERARHVLESYTSTDILLALAIFSTIIDFRIYKNKNKRG